MNPSTVFQHDFATVRRSRLVQGVSVAYLLFTGLLFASASSGTTSFTFPLVLQGLAVFGTLVIPLAALLSTAFSIAGERESGSIRFLLGFPTDRAEVVLGKFCSRLLVVEGSVVLALTVGLVWSFAIFPSVDLVAFVGFVALTALLGSAYVSIGVGISAATDSRARAMTGVVSAFFVLNFLWSFMSPVTVPQLLRSLFNDYLGFGLSQSIFELVGALSPPMAYARGLALASPKVSPISGGATANYLHPAVMVLLLFAWTVLPLVVGYLRFNRAEIS